MKRLILAVTSMLVFSCILKVASAQCEIDEELFSGALVATSIVDGFPTVLSTLEPTELQVECRDVSVMIEVLPPIRVEDSGPILKGPLRSFFDYEDKRYLDGQQVLVSASNNALKIKVGMTAKNGKSILPAANNYLYVITLRITMVEP